MKALSVRQPWASQIAQGEKKIEYRSRATKHRGPLLICATVSPKVAGLPNGQAVCIVEVVGCEKCFEDWGGFEWQLANARSIKPFSVKGQLNIFSVEVPPEALA
jgi:hypothetical protein